MSTGFGASPLSLYVSPASSRRTTAVLCVNHNLAAAAHATATVHTGLLLILPVLPRRCEKRDESEILAMQCETQMRWPFVCSLHCPLSGIF